MPAPTNITAATALEIASLPYTVTLDVSELSAPYEVWFKYTPLTGQVALGVFAWPAAPSASYLPVTSFWTGTPGALVQANPPLAYWGVYADSVAYPKTVPVTAGTTYYIRVRQYGVGSATTPNLYLAVLPGPVETAPAGSLLIPDDTAGYPATILDGTDGHVLRHLHPFPHGEMGAILPSGIILVTDDELDKLALYHADLTLAAKVAGLVGSTVDDGVTYYDNDNPFNPIISCDREHTFYVLTRDTITQVATLRTCSDAGVVGGTVWTMPETTERRGSAPSLDGSIFYYCVAASDAIHRWDLVNNLALPNLVAKSFDTWNAAQYCAYYDLLVLGDGTLLQGLRQSAPNYGGKVLHYAADGTLLHTYTVAAADGYLNRMALDQTDGSFWLWTVGYAGIAGDANLKQYQSRFQQIRISDGAVLTAFTVDEVNQGIGALQADSIDPPCCGPSNSCPLLVLRGEVTGDDGDEGDDDEEQPLPTCEGVQATIVDPPNVNIISGTGTGLNATQWRVVRLEDNVVMASGLGMEASFSFEGDYFVDYQLQFGNGTVWSSTGCTFSFTFPVPMDTMADTTSPCVDYTTQIVNMALSRIGANKFITNLATDPTNEAKVARLHISDDIDRTLRDFPWQFATGYCTWTAPLAGTELVPVNADWQYSYRCPADFIFARRICGQNDERRTFDPNPTPFRLNLDDTWFLIYCNQPATAENPLVLEYTRRPGCPASTPDALFRSCLAWRVAASLAPSLGRDEKVTAYCEQMYRYELPQAEAKSAAEQQQEKDGDAGWIRER